MHNRQNNNRKTKTYLQKTRKNNVAVYQKRATEKYKFLFYRNPNGTRQKNVENLSKLNKSSIEIRSLFYLNAIGIQSQDNIVLSKSYWNPIETLLDFYRNSVVFLSTFYRNTVNLQSLCHQDTRK